MERERIFRILAYIICLAVLPSGFAFGYASMDIMPDDRIKLYDGSRILKSNRGPASLNINSDVADQVDSGDGLDYRELQSLYQEVLIAVKPREVKKHSRDGQKKIAAQRADAICANFMNETYGTTGHATEFKISAYQVSEGDAKKFNLIYCNSGPQRKVASAEGHIESYDDGYGAYYGDAEPFEN